MKRAAPPASQKNPFLVALGERVRSARARRGMTRKALSLAAGVSERHLGNLEVGVGNASILVLVQVADALRCPLAELLAEAELGERGAGAPPRSARVALVGLRGAGKSTLGAMLAEDLNWPFVELTREIERLAGCNVGEIQALYGQTAYRRYERRALEEAVRVYPEAVIATPGGIVSDPGTFNVLLSHCTTVWLQAEPEDHMQRVLAQGDTRPIAASREAMEDLKSILSGRTPFYAKAGLRVDTSAQALPETFALLRSAVREALPAPRATLRSARGGRSSKVPAIR